MNDEQLNAWMLEHLAPLGFRDELDHPLHLSNNVRDALRSALRAEYARGVEAEREKQLYSFKSWRGLDPESGNICDKCGGSGVHLYGSTATWRGGIGGQMMTTGVCDKCWGSGDDTKPWPSRRVFEQKLQAEYERGRDEPRWAQDAEDKHVQHIVVGDKLHGDVEFFPLPHTQDGFWIGHVPGSGRSPEMDTEAEARAWVEEQSKGGE